MSFTAHGLKVGPDVVAQHTVPLAGARTGRAVCAARRGDKRQRFSFKGGRGRGGEAGRAVREKPIAPRATPGLLDALGYGRVTRAEVETLIAMARASVGATIVGV